MGSERWQQIAALVDSALDIEPVARAGFLDKACAGNESLRQEVESLLAMADSSFLEVPALELLFGGVAPEAELPSFKEGAQIGPYRITGFLGAGGMGEVYRATDTRLGRQVALKFLPARLSNNPEALERFQREARSESALNHPNICTLYDVGEHEGQPYLVMELLEGESLKQRLERGPLSPPEVVELGVAVSEALEAAHVRGIVHRDIKPANIFLTPHGRAKVLDFGIAKLLAEPAPGPPAEAGSVPVPAWETTGTERGRAVGTIAYMSPEQARGEEVDPRSDLFSLGVTLYEAATGRQPFRKETPQATLEAVLSQAPAPPRSLNPAVPVQLERTIAKALEKDPAARYGRASDLAADLEQIRRSAEPARRVARLWMVAAALSAVVAVCA
ncbi:MAG: serine/threonine protein kinase, partial [Bryobacterales bacterium]|nr:serine/threonine protein kinase [Bryobacterales bacterium]